MSNNPEGTSASVKLIHIHYIFKMNHNLNITKIYDGNKIYV